MKIEPSINSVAGVNGASASAEARARSTGKTSSTEDGAAAVHLSVPAQKIQRNVSTDAAADPGRIAEIRQAIADGNFQIDPNAIADRIIMTARALIASR
ncbi:MAG: flagellar biosynthesis anti-sigma factor FlgM [Betaproteobacteria bacterium]|nr:flagellar biosynthesis anti-sigma factor FlgM [Betaproteobacteria bacterium]